MGSTGYVIVNRHAHRALLQITPRTPTAPPAIKNVGVSGTGTPTRAYAVCEYPPRRAPRSRISRTSDSPRLCTLQSTINRPPGYANARLSYYPPIRTNARIEYVYRTSPCGPANPSSRRCLCFFGASSFDIQKFIIALTWSANPTSWRTQYPRYTAPSRRLSTSRCHCLVR